MISLQMLESRCRPQKVECTCSNCSKRNQFMIYHMLDDQSLDSVEDWRDEANGVNHDEPKESLQVNAKFALQHPRD